MKNFPVGFIALGALVLSACGQVPDVTPSSTAAAPAPFQVTLLSPAQQNALRHQLQELRDVQAQVAAGTLTAPVDDAGQVVDLGALIQSFELDLQMGAQPLNIEVPSGKLNPQAAPYAQYIYTNIAGDNNFRGNYSFNKSRFPRFNWSNDGCSGPSEYTGWSDEFYWPCLAHDFGYRNARLYPNLLNGNHRAWVDSQFKQHMRLKCDTLGWRKYPCYAAAEGFYQAVRLRGAGSFYP
ncbi:phospholipase A2 [Deinococcus sp. QL22]|uniref:phospholipase A2 n=1 Tax=Deinococcus sp. QL22 TaxID=2939437 RepID=UPI002017D4E5|nr:phospholipase A2 [Deinococcus sp. QL22]UQN09321.1 phospholipase [Deinococcus sp. QL22]